MSLPASMTEQVDIVKNYEISYRQLHPTAILQDNVLKRNISIPYSSLTNKYRVFLSNIVVTTIFDNEATAYYRFKPKRLSQDLYQTPELWNDILILNNCVSVSEFEPTKVKAYDPTRLKEYLNEILILEGMLD